MLTKNDYFLRSDIVFLNHGSFGACPRVVIEEQRKWQERMEQQPVLFFREAPELLKNARVKLGEYIGADADDVAFVTNSTYAVNVAAHAAARWLKSGDEVLTTDQEYSACIYAWEEHLKGTGASLVVAETPMPVSDTDDLVEIIWSRVTPRTRVLFLSHITSTTAVVLPIEELCKRARQQGIITIIDGAHSAGLIDVDVRTIGADVYTSNCHKWMNTPKGSAYMWCAPDKQEWLSPLVTSWGAPMVAANAGMMITRHEYVGTRDLSPFLTIPFVLEWMKANDWSGVRQRAREIITTGRRLIGELDGMQLLTNYEQPIQLFTTLLPDGVDADKLKVMLYDDHNIEVVVMPWLNKGVLRAAAHAHTTENDMVLLRDAVRECVKLLSPRGSS